MTSFHDPSHDPIHTTDEETILLLEALKKGVNGTRSLSRSLNELQKKEQQRLKSTLQKKEQDVDVDQATVAIGVLGRPQFFSTLYVNALSSLRSCSAALVATPTDSTKPLYNSIGPNYEVDVLVIGVGIHDQVFCNTLRNQLDSNLRVLSIGDGPYVSMNTHNADTRVFANSSTRESREAPVSGEFLVNQPGTGNINFFPGGRLQLSSGKFSMLNCVCF